MWRVGFSRHSFPELLTFQHTPQKNASIYSSLNSRSLGGKSGDGWWFSGIVESSLESVESASHVLHGRSQVVSRIARGLLC